MRPRVKGTGPLIACPAPGILVQFTPGDVAEICLRSGFRSLFVDGLRCGLKEKIREKVYEVDHPVGAADS